MSLAYRPQLLFENPVRNERHAESKAKKICLQGLIDNVFKELDVNGIRAIYLVGSAASNEETLLNTEMSSKCLSDMDLILDVSIPQYIKFRVLHWDSQLAQALSATLKAAGYDIHVSIGVTCSSLSVLVPGIAPNSIFQLEMRPLSTYSSRVARQKRVHVSKPDAFDLAISSLADYVFLNLDPEKEKTHDDCYTLAKRSLTLLHSILLFNNLSSPSYRKRIILAEKNINKLSAVLTPGDLSLLGTLTDFKSSGDIKLLLTEVGFPTEDYSGLFRFLESYFRKLAEKVLTFELQAMTGCPIKELRALAREYIRANHKSSTQIVLQLFRLAPLIFESNKTSLKLALYSLRAKKLTLDKAIQYLVLIAFLSVGDSIAMMREPNRLKQTKQIWDCFKN